MTDGKACQTTRVFDLNDRHNREKHCKTKQVPLANELETRIVLVCLCDRQDRLKQEAHCYKHSKAG